MQNLLVQMQPRLKSLGITLLGISVFLGFWLAAASSIKVSFGSIPGPIDVLRAGRGLLQEHRLERQKAREFYERQAQRKEKFLSENPGKIWKERKYSGKPTYIDQIFTSLLTVFAGFAIGSLIAVPLGVLSGLSKTIHGAINPFVQIFKPVSPLAWLPLVMILVSALYNPTDPLMEKSFLSSAITVALCSLWPTLINTAVGVTSIDNDFLNVARVLKLGFWKKTAKIVIPSALPYIFTGLRLSLGVGWMVLIATEMLAQNPGLGKFVWDMFQNGSNQTLSLIMVAVFTIGFIGFLLDRIMQALQQMVTYEPAR